MSNTIQSLLISIGLCTDDSIQEFFPRVRDRDDVRVMRCSRSGIIFLLRCDHITDSHYAEQVGMSYWSADNRKQALLESFDDDRRRSRQFEMFIRQQRWLDVGTGVGGLLDLLSGQASEVCAVEPQEAVRRELIRCGYDVYANLADAKSDHFDVVTLFHVLEHLPDPIDTLAAIAEKLVKGGRVVVEVPHANDFLISFLDLEPFKRFTFWSEHLILHTRASLEGFLREAGFRDIQILGFQRYPLANHLYWLANGKPGGHKEWAFLSGDELDAAYMAKLVQLDRTDTLIAIARRE